MYFLSKNQLGNLQWKLEYAAVRALFSDNDLHPV